MMSQNRQSERDREHAEADYKVNKDSKLEIEGLISKLDGIEREKLDIMLEIISKINDHNHEHLHQVSKELLEIKEILNSKK